MSRHAKYTIRLAMAALAALLSLCLFSCSGGGELKYTILSPVVDPGEVLTGDDFIMKSAFSRADYTVELDGDAPTDEPGYHKITVTVKDSHGSAHTHVCSYTVRSYLRDSVRIEIGDPVTVEKFINTAVGSYHEHTFEFEDAYAVADLGIGTHTVNIKVDDVVRRSTLILEDTTPPEGQPVTVHITSQTGTPRADDFVSNIKDATSVACTFKETYDFNTTDDVVVVVILTDEAGNQTEITALATCAVDTTAPEIHGVRDITVYVGESPSYREGITVTDDSGEVPRLDVDVSRVNPNAVGSYEITYSAQDSSGNKTIVRAVVNVIERPAIPESEVNALAKKIYTEEILPAAVSTSKYDIARAVYNWTHDKIKYDSKVKADETDPIGAAYSGMTDKKGNAFTYMIVAAELLEEAGIDCRRIVRLGDSGSTEHWWLLVNVGNGFYHFDPCPQTAGPAFDAFMRTDAELEAYGKSNGIEYYYRFDLSKYPARGTTSYYETGGTEE